MNNDLRKKKKKKRKANNLFEEPAMIFLGKIFDMILLNVYWLLSCIPVFTIGTATSSMYYVTLKMARNDNIRSFKDYFLGFKLTFKRAALSMLFVIPLVLICYLNVSFIMGNGLNLPVWGLCIFAIPILLVAMFISIYFPLLGFYQCGIKTTVLNAAVFAVRHPIRSLIVLALNLVPFAMLFFYIELFLEWIIIWTFLGFGAIAYINSKILLKAFQEDLGESDYPYIDDFIHLS